MYENLTDYQKKWIVQHYDDPDVEQKLKAEFFDVVSEDQYRELKNYMALNRAIYDASEYHLHLAKDIASIPDYYTYYNIFLEAILDIEKLLEMEVDISVAPCFFRLLYANVIIAIETYLSDVFIGTVKNNPDLMRRFIETTPEFKEDKISLSDAYSAKEQADKKADDYLFKVAWHNVARVKQMYKDTLSIEFPEDISAISRAIQNRHDIVHRNGKTKTGKELRIEKPNILALIDYIDAFAKDIDIQLEKIQLNTNT